MLQDILVAIAMGGVPGFMAGLFTFLVTNHNLFLTFLFGLLTCGLFLGFLALIAYIDRRQGYDYELPR